MSISRRSFTGVSIGSSAAAQGAFRGALAHNQLPALAGKTTLTPSLREMSVPAFVCPILAQR